LSALWTRHQETSSVTSRHFFTPAILQKEPDMHISMLTLTPLISLIAGVLILVMPRLLNYIVALYLIVVGLLGLFPNLAG
jgi:hypothetical protein